MFLKRRFHSSLRNFMVITSSVLACTSCRRIFAAVFISLCGFISFSLSHSSSTPFSLCVQCLLCFQWCKYKHNYNIMIATILLQVVFEVCTRFSWHFCVQKSNEKKLINIVVRVHHLLFAWIIDMKELIFSFFSHRRINTKCDEISHYHSCCFT